MPHAYRFAATPSGSRPVWCVVASFPKAERTAHAELHRRGFEAYLPLLTRRLPDRHYRTGPLFPGYVFVRMRLDLPWNPVRYAPGVFSLLSMDGKPSIVARAVIEALRAGEALRASPTQPTPQWAPGMPCRAGKGHAFRDLDAVVISVTEKRAVVAIIWANSLQRVNLPISHLEPRGDP
jgi:transcription antitermination factor NusG